ncbi:hypothetical protein TcWFU_001313 [Taenia crassiceps]|uniref:Uncharacterized protein n=1 Tax=Taenia crassiceps TaxID=6207 RepID=A0ABR4QA24_9CEST
MLTFTQDRQQNATTQQTNVRMPATPSAIERHPTTTTAAKTTPTNEDSRLRISAVGVEPPFLTPVAADIVTEEGKDKKDRGTDGAFQPANLTSNLSSCKVIGIALLF